MKRLSQTTLPDPVAERVRQEQHAAITDLQRSPMAACRIVRDVSLADATPTPVAHGLGRSPSAILPSAPRGATSTGRITEVRTGTSNRAGSVVLQADGWGATITVDIVFL